VTEHQVIVNHSNAAIRIVAFKGQIDSTACGDLEEVLMAQLQNGHKYVIIDMSGVDHISSRGLRMLVAVWKRAHDAQGDLIIAGLRPHLREVMGLIGFDLVFTIQDTVEDALNGLQA
jgi:stage II sporulation protein AA (anti-sigma F factor antagonist)